MTPKEALNIIQDNITPRTLGILTVEFNIVEKALDRLELLEKENRVIKNSILGTTEIEWINENHKLTQENEELQKENQELTKQKNATIELMKLMTLDNDIVESALILDKYKTENEKLKKAIEILKVKTNLKIETNEQNNPFITYDIWGSSAITKKEYELLKEVLENENN